MALRIGVIGAGNMGRTHARWWAKVDGVELAGIVDHRQDMARNLGPAFDTFEELLAHAKPDVIDICTPTPGHREYVERAAAAGLAVFVEKPLARTLADCDAIVATVERTTIPLMVGHVVRYFPEFQKARDLVLEGAVGRPAAVRTARLAGFPGGQGAQTWYSDFKRSGGVVLDLMIHDFDWLRWCFGPVERVFARGLAGQERHQGLRDYALVTLRFASGAMAHVTGSWTHPGGFRTQFEIAGDAGLLEYDSARSVPLTVAARAVGQGTAPGGVAVPESPLAEPDDPYYRELQAFVEALKAGTPPPVTAQEAREAVCIALAALESIETGKVVTPA